MQRTVLATIASGGDPRNVGGRDLVADGIYYRDNVSPLGKEGVNGYSWGLIALDSKSFETPEWALSNRNDILPKDITDELSKLQNHVKPFDENEAINIIEKELGKTIDEAFKSFERTPKASASISQVHEAVFKKRREGSDKSKASRYKKIKY